MPYRSDLAALRTREETLERELAELGDIAVRKARLERELESVRSLMRGARVGGALRVLRTPAITLPCDVPWDGMSGDDRVRFCGKCAKNVYNLSAMTRNEAADLMDRESEPCVRYYQRPDGTVLTTDCAIGAGKRRRKRISSAAAAGVLAACAAAATVEGISSPEPLRLTTVDQLIEANRVGTIVRVEGKLVHGSLEKRGDEHIFALESRGKVLRVRHPFAVVPDTFRDLPDFDVTVLVEGKLQADGTFVSQSLVARSPTQGYTMKDRR